MQPSICSNFWNDLIYENFKNRASFLKIKFRIMLVTTKEQLLFSSLFVNIISKCLASNYFHKFNHSKITTCCLILFTDINECLDSNGGCSHNCTNTVGSYYCECASGFILQPNNHNCTEGT